MSNALRKIERKKQAEVVDIEAAAEKAKQKRVETCMTEVNAVLEKYRCDVQCAVQFGDQVVPLAAIFTLPSKVNIVSK